MNIKSNISKMKSSAEEYCRNGDFYCSEAVKGSSSFIIWQDFEEAYLMIKLRRLCGRN